MPIDVGALGGVVMRATLDELGSLVLEDADDLSGGSADGVVHVAAALIQASLAAAQDRDSWIRAQPDLSNGQGLASAAVAMTLARVALTGGRAAVARSIWDLCGGSACHLWDGGAVWVAGPVGLAIYGGTSRASSLTGWESAVEVETWDNILRRMNESK